MSILEKIRELQATAIPSSPEPVFASADEAGEVKIRRKAGILAAFGLADKAIADTLFLSLEQIQAIKETLEFRESCSKQTQERAQRAIDLEEGWDSIESQGIAQVMQTLQFSRDPEFALRAAVFANRAQRRAVSSIGRVIDASHVGNVITLTVNKNYVTNNNAIVNLKSADTVDLPRKASDVSSPKRLATLLNLDEEKSRNKQVANLAETLGISLDELDEMIPPNQNG